MDRVRIFISSPGDVADERQRALAVVQHLQEEFNESLSLEPLLWEQEPLLATADFQSQIRSPADFDVFATIIGSRLGSPLGTQFTRDDGSPYASGTEFEFEIAVASHHATGKPELLFYRKELPPGQPQTDQLTQVQAFFKKWFPEDGSDTIGSYHRFAQTGQFEELFTTHLRKVLYRFLPRPNNLPAPISSFLGRTEVIREIGDLLRRADVRLLNLTGPARVGKSRVALRTARGLMADFQDGIFLVNPTSQQEKNSLPGVIADALDIEAGHDPISTVIDMLRDKQLLLLVDNTDQQEPFSDTLAALLAACPKLKIMATSREAVSIAGMHTLAVQPFPLPDAAQATFTELRNCDCVQLFAQRATAVRVDFRLTEESAREILRICHRLAGLPGAIELAATRMRSLNTTKILRSLDTLKVKDETGQAIYLLPR